MSITYPNTFADIDKKNVIRMSFIKKILVEEGFSPEAFYKNSRIPELVRVRRWFFWLTKKRFGDKISYREMANFLGKQDHCTPLHHVKQQDAFNEAYSSDKALSKRLLEKVKDYVNIKEILKEYPNNDRIEEWISKTDEKLSHVEDHIVKDAVMEGWRKYQILSTINKLRNQIESIKFINNAN